MPFLSPNQRRQSRERRRTISVNRTNLCFTFRSAGRRTIYRQCAGGVRRAYDTIHRTPRQSPSRAITVTMIAGQSSVTQPPWSVPICFQWHHQLYHAPGRCPPRLRNEARDTRPVMTGRQRTSTKEKKYSSDVMSASLGLKLPKN